MKDSYVKVEWVRGAVRGGHVRIKHQICQKEKFSFRKKEAIHRVKIPKMVTKDKLFFKKTLQLLLITVTLESTVLLEWELLFLIKSGQQYFNILS